MFFCGVLVLVLVRRQFGAVAVVDVDTGVILSGNVVVVVVFAIAWNTTNASHELARIFFCLVLVLVLAERRF